MPITCIQTFLVHPGKNAAEERQFGGTRLKLEGKLFELLSGVYDKSDKECDIEISFNHDTDGKQNNPCRDLIIEFVKEPTLKRGQSIAVRLERVTTHRSGLGLLFLILGNDDHKRKLVISRFPADSGILAEENRQELTVEFLERVFMKSATAYKAAAYEDTSLASGFWFGKAVDKQINNPSAHLSNYWISDFLASGFSTTAAFGTRRLAEALRNATKGNLAVSTKSEISAAVTLAGNLKNRKISIQEFLDHFGFSKAAREAIENEVRRPEILNESFQFDAEEFHQQIAFRSIELDSGGILTASTIDFDQAFQSEIIDGEQKRVRYSAEGKIVSEKLGKSR